MLDKENDFRSSEMHIYLFSEEPRVIYLSFRNLEFYLLFLKSKMLINGKSTQRRNYRLNFLASPAYFRYSMIFTLLHPSLPPCLNPYHRWIRAICKMRISPSKNLLCQSKRFHTPSTSYGRIDLCIPYAAAAARYYATSRLVALHFTCVPTRTCRLHYMISRASVWHSTLSSLLFPFVLTFSFFAQSRRPINKTCSLRNARTPPPPPSLSLSLSLFLSLPLLLFVYSYC